MKAKRVPLRALGQWWPRRSHIPEGVPAWARPLVRIALVALVVLAGNRLTGILIDHGWTMGLGTVIAVRLVTALPILRYPFEGFVLALEVDKWDWYWLAAGSRPEAYQALYQQWDKVLDLFLLAMALVVALGWRDAIMRRIAISTFALRVAGVAAFLVTEQRWVLVAFPNVFETLFLMYVVFQLISGRNRMLRDAPSTLLVVLTALLPKVAEEYFLHVLDRRPWDWVHLPVPSAIEPQVWLVAMYLPPFVAVVVLALQSRGWTAGGAAGCDSAV